MNCKEFKNRIPDYLDQNLSPDLNKRFNEHLQNCAACSMLFGKVMNSVNLLNKAEHIVEQPFYFTSLKQKLENRTIQKHTIFESIISKKVLQPVLYLASIIIAVYIGILIGSGTTNNKQYAGTSNTDTSYIEVFAQYQYINDMDLEPLEKNMFNENILDSTNNN